MVLDGEKSDEVGHEVSRTSSAVAEEGPGLSMYPRIPTHRHYTDRRRTSVENGSAMTSSPEAHHSHDADGKEDIQAQVVALTWMAGENDVWSGTGCHGQNEGRVQMPNAMSPVCPWSGESATWSGVVDVTVGLCVDFWEGNRPFV